jgi:hypothetical protein
MKIALFASPANVASRWWIRTEIGVPKLANAWTFLDNAK